MYTDDAFIKWLLNFLVPNFEGMKKKKKDRK